MLLGLAVGRGGDALLAWAAAPALLLALADAAYLVQSRRIAALAVKETVRADDLFRLQSGSAGFAASIQTLGGLASFSVWPFYAVITTMVIVLGQSVLLPPKKPQLLPQNSSFIASPHQPTASRPSSFTPPKGVPSFQTQPNHTVNRPSMPPMGVPASKPNFPGSGTKSPTVPGGSSSTPAGLNRPSTNTFAPQPPKISPGSNTTLNSSFPKPGTSQTQPPK